MASVRSGWLLAGLVLLVPGAGVQAQTADPVTAEAAARALGPIFQADMPTALERLAALPEGSLNDRQRRVRDCIVARFKLPSPQAAPLPDALPAAPDALPAAAATLLAAYRRYWTAVLMHSVPADAAEAQLSSDLAPMAGREAHDLESREKAAARTVEAQGLFVLGGVTPPLQELMLWRKQTATTQTVALPGGPIDVRVTLLDDFASFGWVGWGTCDAAHTGGWATADRGIMVVVPSWDLASEGYRVSLLAHESQHFSDYKRYPKLAPTDLEYRAKLVELTLAHDTQRKLLDKFAAEAARNRAAPHPFASWWIGERLRLRLGRDPMSPEVSGDAIREAAAAELRAHGAALDAQGAARVETALPD